MAVASRRARSWLRAMLVAYWGLLFVVTHLPARSIQAIDPFGSGQDKLQHFAGYFGLAMGGVLLLAAYGMLRPARLWWIWGACSAYGMLDELLQIPVGRTADWRDWLADTAGAGAACLTGAVLIRLRPQTFAAPPADETAADSAHADPSA